MLYKIKYKRDRGLFYKTLKNVKGHIFDEKQECLVVYFNYGIITIPNWKNYHMKLGNDFLLSQKTSMEEESNQNINIRKD